MENQIIAEYVMPHAQGLIVLAADIDFSPGKIVTSPEAAVVRKKIWEEMNAVLINLDSEVRIEY